VSSFASQKLSTGDTMQKKHSRIYSEYDFTKTRKAHAKNVATSNARSNEGKASRHFETQTKILAQVVLSNDDL
jgi:hypothetical protein